MYKCKYCGNGIKNIGAFHRHQQSCKHINVIKDELVALYTDSNKILGISELSKQYHIGKETCTRILKECGVYRNLHEANLLARHQHPDSYKHTEESKAKLRVKRLAWMKANPTKTAWRTRNIPSYPEKLFMRICKENSLYDKYDIVREYSEFPYYIDFAFLNVKVAIEVDGSQHWLDSDRIASDVKKDEYIRNNGWRVMRIPEFKLKNAYNSVVRDVLDFLSDITITDKRYDADIIEFERIRNDRNRVKQLKKELKKRIRLRQHNEVIASRKIDFDELYPGFGWSTELGKRWNMTSQAASRYCKKYFDVVDGHMSISRDVLDECINQRMTIKEIAKKFNLNPSTIVSYRNKYGIKPCSTPQLLFDWESIDLSSLLNQYNMSEIARKLGTSPRSVRNRALKEGIIT